MADKIRYIYEHESPEWDAHFIQWEENVMSIGTFDHRCIHALHDLIAAQYRKNLLDETSPAMSIRKRDGRPDFFKNEAFDFLQEEEFV